MPSDKPLKARLSFDRGLYDSDDDSKASTGHMVQPTNDVRVLNAGSVDVRDGLTTVLGLPAGFTPVGMGFFEGLDGTRRPVISDGAAVYVLEATGWFLVGNFPLPGTEFRSRNHFGRLYMVNGASVPHRLRWTGSVWEFREVGLNSPANPTAGATPPFVDLIDPATSDLHFLTMNGSVGVNGSIFGSNSSGTEFERFDVDTGAWELRAVRPEADLDFQVLGTFSDGRTIYAPGIRTTQPSVAQADADNRKTFYHDDVANAWTANRSIIGGSRYWAPGSSFAQSRPAWGGVNLAVLYFFTVNHGWAVYELGENGVNTTTTNIFTLDSNLFGPGQEMDEYLRFTASQIVPVDTVQEFYVLANDTAAGRTRFWRHNIGSGTTVEDPTIAAPPFTLSRFDRAVYSGGSTFDVYIEGTNDVWRYDISGDNWTLIQDSGDHYRGITGGSPVNALVYSFQSAAGTDFVSSVQPPAPGGGGGGGKSFGVAVTFVDNLAHESSGSGRLTVNNVPVGAPINLNIPTSTSPYVVSRRIYSTLPDDPTGTLFFVQTISDNATTAVSISSFASDRDQTLIMPEENPPPEAGARFISAFGNRLALGNFSNKPTRTSFSYVDNAEAFPDALKKDFADRGSLLGFVIGHSFFAAIFDSSTVVWTQDPLTQDPIVALNDVGCDDPNSVVTLKGGGMWLAEQGFVFFNGFDATFVDCDIDNLVDEFRGANRTASIESRGLARFSYEDPADSSRTKVLIYEHDACGTNQPRWLLDTYPIAIRAWAVSKTGQTIAAPPSSTTPNVDTSLDFASAADVAAFENVGSGFTISGVVGPVVTLNAPPGPGIVRGAAVSIDSVVFNIDSLGPGANDITLDGSPAAGPFVLDFIRGTTVAGGVLDMEGVTTGAGTVLDSSRDFNEDADIGSFENLEDPSGQFVNAAPTATTFTLSGVMNAKVKSGCVIKFDGKPTPYTITGVAGNTITVPDTAGIAQNDTVEFIRGIERGPGNIRLTGTETAVVESLGGAFLISASFANAQTFTVPTNTTVNRLDINFRQDTGTRRYALIEIRQGNPSAYPWNQGPVIRTVYSGVGVVYPDGWNTFTFAPLALNSGTNYFIRIVNGVAGPDTSGGPGVHFYQTFNSYPDGQWYDNVPRPDLDTDFRLFAAAAGHPINSFYSASAVAKTSFPGFVAFSANALTITDTPNGEDIVYSIDFGSGQVYWTGAAWAAFTDPATQGMLAATVNGLIDADLQSAGGFVSGSPNLELFKHLRTATATVTPTLDQFDIEYIASTFLHPAGYPYQTVLTARTTFTDFDSMCPAAVDPTQTTPALTDVRYAFRFFSGDVDRYHNGTSWVPVVTRTTDGMTKAEVEALTDAQWQSASGFVSAAPYRQVVVYQITNDENVRPTVDQVNDCYNEITGGGTPTVIGEGVVTVDNSDFNLMDSGNDDAGTAIPAVFTPRPPIEEEGFRETNYDGFLLDGVASAPYVIGVENRLDGGAVQTLDSVQSSTSGRIEEFRRLPRELIGRILNLTFRPPKGVTISRVFVTHRPRQRRAGC